MDEIVTLLNIAELKLTKKKIRMDYSLMRSGGNGKFDWPRMHKDEEHIEREAYDCVEHAICQHYNIEDISELTEKQWEEIHAWQEENGK